MSQSNRPNPWQRFKARLSGRAKLLSVRWHGAENAGQAARALALRAARMPVEANKQTTLLLLGRADDFRVQVEKELNNQSIPFLACTTEQIQSLRAEHFYGIVCSETQTPGLMKVLVKVQQAKAFSTLPFEYVTGLESGRAIFRRLDEYAHAHFISPLLHDPHDPYSIYQDSLNHFEQKTGLRDFLDLYQALVELERNNTTGAVCEFGSYRGHSGWLMARSLAAHHSARQLYMFDTFDSFPQENLGVDSLWNDTHTVNFNQVQALLKPFKQVHLVKGDITETWPEQDIGPIALAYVDCDSYRAIKFLTAALWEQHISPGGMMIFEDYGHPALLGCRQAVHEFFDQRQDCRCFFSQFSGLMLVTKLS